MKHIMITRSLHFKTAFSMSKLSLFSVNDYKIMKLLRISLLCMLDLEPSLVKCFTDNSD